MRHMISRSLVYSQSLALHGSNESINTLRNLPHPSIWWRAAGSLARYQVLWLRRQHQSRPCGQLRSNTRHSDNRKRKRRRKRPQGQPYRWWKMPTQTHPCDVRRSPALRWVDANLHGSHSRLRKAYSSKSRMTSCPNQFLARTKSKLLRLSLSTPTKIEKSLNKDRSSRQIKHRNKAKLNNRRSHLFHQSTRSRMFIQKRNSQLPRLKVNRSSTMVRKAKSTLRLSS